MTCAELTAVGLPAVYVPLPIGNGEQRLNALPIVQRGGGLLVEDAELTADWIKASLLPVLTNIDQVAGMSEAAAAMGRKDADRWLAKAVIEIIAAETAGRPAAAPGGSQPRPSAAAWPAPSSQPGRPAPQDWPARQDRPARQDHPVQQDRPASPAGTAPPAPEPGSLFTPRSARQQPPAGPAPHSQAAPRFQAAQNHQAPPPHPDGQQRPPGQGGGRHRQAR
jgi:hypothetical protein